MPIFRRVVVVSQSNRNCDIGLTASHQQRYSLWALVHGQNAVEFLQERGASIATENLHALTIFSFGYFLLLFSAAMQLSVQGTNCSDTLLFSCH